MMPRMTLDQDIGRLMNEILLLGSMVEEAVVTSVEALCRRDMNARDVICRRDEEINSKRYTIENWVAALIATQQPAAHDLRLLISALEISTELERMGDYAKGIARITYLLGDDEIDLPSYDLIRMSDLALHMLHNGLSAFIAEDYQMAFEVVKMDDQVDNLYNTIYRRLVNNMITNPQAVDSYSHLLWAIHNLERLADRVVNICERTVYIATGDLLEISEDLEDEIPSESQR